ncbi:MAG: SH3 domain-containing protein [Lachnospiraceae bacterium]|nr:SH3 domain-containing protein [Lachnospiraceae bacterium]
MKTKSEKIRQVIMTAVIVAAVLAILFGKQFAMIVMASAGKVTSTTANVRAQASTTSDAIASLSKGDTIDIKSQTTGADGYIWYQITVDANTTGYIRSDLVEITDGTTPATSTATATTTTTTTTTTATVNSDGVTPVETVSGTTTADVNVRADASTNSEIVAKANNGLTLSVTGTKQGTDGNTWYYLTFTKDGVSTTGYIRSDYVKLSGELKAPTETTSTPDPVPTTTETTQPTIQKIWDTQEQADGWFLLDYNQGKQYNIDNLFKTNETNTELIEKQESRIKSLRTGLIILVILLIAAIVAAVIFFMKWKDLDDRAAFAEAEKERTKRIAGHGEGRRPQGQERPARNGAAREGARRDAASGERRRPEGARPADRQSGERPAARPAAGERRPVDVQKGQSSHTVRPSENAERRAAEPSREAAVPVREEVRTAAPEPAQAPEADVAERKPHRPRTENAPAPKEHHRKPPVDDDDDEFEFGFLNWDDDDK